MHSPAFRVLPALSIFHRYKTGVSRARNVLLERAANHILNCHAQLAPRLIVLWRSGPVGVAGRRDETMAERALRAGAGRGGLLSGAVIISAGAPQGVRPAWHRHDR